MRRPSSGGGAPYGSHVGWRIFVLSNMAGGSNSRTSAGQIEFQDSLGNLFSTSGATVFEGGTGSVNAAASNAFDGSPTVGNPWSRVSTNGGNGCYIGAVYTVPKAVAQVTITNPTTSWGGFETDSILSAKLQYSDDTTVGTDGTWTDAFTFWEPSWPASTQVSRTHPQTFLTGQYKAFQILATASNDSNAHMAVDEIEFRATAGGADQTGNTVGHHYMTSNVRNGANGFDNNTSTFTDRFTGTSSSGFGFAFATPTSVAEYAVSKFVFVSEAIRDWTLRGTTDGVNFTTLDTRTGQSFTGGQTKTYTI